MNALPCVEMTVVDELTAFANAGRFHTACGCVRDHVMLAYRLDSGDLVPSVRSEFCEPLLQMLRRMTQAAEAQEEFDDVGEYDGIDRDYYGLREHIIGELKRAVRNSRKTRDWWKNAFRPLVDDAEFREIFGR